MYIYSNEGRLFLNLEGIFVELLKWMGGGGIALLGLLFTRKRDKSDKQFSIINDLQEENKRKDERLDRQDEKIQYLVDQMDEMRKEMFEIQTDKHKSEVKNIELKSKNDRLEREKSDAEARLEISEKEKERLRVQLEDELTKVKRELNEKINKLINENEKLREQISELQIKTD